MIKVINDKEKMWFPTSKGRIMIPQGIPYEVSVEEYQLLSLLYKNIQRVQIVDLPKHTKPVKFTSSSRRSKKSTQKKKS